MTPAFPSDPAMEISPADTAQALADDSALVIDVRETYERDAGYIDGSRHIELERLASQSDSVDKTRTVIFYCRAGVRSAMAADAFRAAGYDARSMAGGISAWDAEGRPLAPEGGSVADH